MALPVSSTRARQPDQNAGCPIAPVIDIVFSRWTTPILWQLHTHGRLRFNDLRTRTGDVTAKVLTQRLRQLERDGLLTRHHYAEIPPRVEYEITALGASLSPVFAALVVWSTNHLEDVGYARIEYDQSDKPLP